MQLIDLLKSSIGLTTFVVLASCSDDNRPATFRGDPWIAGSDPDAVVLTIDDPRYPSVLLIQENGAVSLGVFQAKTGSPALTIRDADNDGVFDLLTYSALWDSGETLIDVEDWGMDGQPDFILNHQDSSASVFVDGSWYEVDGIGTRDVTVLLDGKRIALKELVTTLGRPW